MLVQRILSFISTLNDCYDLQEFDKSFLIDFEANFLALQLKPNDEILFDLLDWTSFFSTRWAHIVDTEYDYTISDYSQSNECWIELAYDLSKISNKTYLQILIPTAKTQTIDPILLCRSADYAADCFISVLPKLPVIASKDYINSYLYIEEKGILFYFKNDVPTEILRLDSTNKDKFAHELLALMSGKETNYVSGQQFNALLTDNGYYPRFELRNFYLTNLQDELDNEKEHGLRCCRGLFVRMDVGCPLSTFEHYTLTDPRQLTLLELSRIRNKKGELLFIYHGTTYRNMWEAIMNTEIVGWHMRGKLPAYLFPSLIKIVDLYFSEGAFEKDLDVGLARNRHENFRLQVLAWSKQLQNCSIEDAYNLYGQTISVENKDFYLIELLSDCILSSSTDLRRKMLGIARWLSNFDASLVGEAVALRGLYKELKVGHYFNINVLRRMVLELNNDDFYDTKGAISLLSSTLNAKEKIDHTVIEALRKIYERHWLDIQNQAAEYTPFAHKAKVTDPWLRLAQLLSGAGLLESNYFLFLMPTLKSKSLTYLLQIRSENESFYFDFLNQTYESVGLYFGRSIQLKRQLSAECPRHMLPDLVALVDDYFRHRRQGIDLISFRTKLIAWSQHFGDCSIDDVNCLFSQKIELANTSIYLLDILLDSLRDDSIDLDAKFLSLANWLCNYDLSFIGDAEELLPLYEKLGVGSRFSIKTLQQLLVTFEKSSDKIKELVNLLAHRLNDKLVIDDEVIEALRVIYKTRWLEIRYNANDYIRNQTGDNTEWIRCAQLLSGAGYISENYYCFLMPTIKDEPNPITFERLHYYPLSHYIHEDLDEGELHDRLILVDNCVRKYKAVGTFYKPAGRLSTSEMDRLVFSKFYKYKDIARWAEQDERLNLSTVLVIKDLAEALNPEGLKRINYYENIALVEKVMYDFYDNIYLKLPDDERMRLDEQRIVFNDICQSFKETLDDVLFKEQITNGKRGEGHCSALALQRFACLVMDYAPYLRFNRTIESDKKCRVKEMRASSRLKLFRAPELIEKQIQTLFFSLLTRRSGSYFEGTITVSIWGYSTSLNTVAKQIYDKLLPMFQSGSFDNAPEIYAMMIDSIVKPAIADKTILTSMFRSNDTLQWLQSICTGSLFLKQDLLYEPECLLDVLMRMSRKKSPYKIALCNFLDLFMSVFSQQCSPELMKLQINLKFVNFLQTFDEDLRKQLRDMVQISKDRLLEFDLQQMCLSYILKRLNLIDPPTTGDGKVRFFPKRFSQDIKGTTSVRETIDRLVGFVRSQPKTERRHVMLSYLNQIKFPRLDSVAVKRQSSMTTSLRK